MSGEIELVVTKEIVKDEGKKPESMQDAMLQIVSRKDIDPDRLEKFLDIQIKMEDRQNAQAFNEAMAKFQGKCPIIKRIRKTDFESKTGGKVKYNYSPLDEIVYVIKPILGEFGLSFAFDIKADGKDVSTLITTIYHSMGHSKTFNYDFPTIHDDGRMNISQRRKSALTYAKRAGLENALGIVTAEEDDDAKRAIDTAISQEQLTEIEALIQQTKVDRNLVLKFAQTDDFKNLDAFAAKKVILSLKQRRASCIK